MLDVKDVEDAEEAYCSWDSKFNTIFGILKDKSSLFLPMQQHTIMSGRRCSLLKYRSCEGYHKWLAVHCFGTHQESVSESGTEAAFIE